MPVCVSLSVRVRACERLCAYLYLSLLADSRCACVSPSDKIFQDAALSGRLTANNGDLWQIDSERDSEPTEGVLQSIDDRDELFHADIAPCRTHGRRCIREGLDTRRAREVEKRRKVVGDLITDERT